jgi:hypothetical protein
VPPGECETGAQYSLGVGFRIDKRIAVLRDGLPEPEGLRHAVRSLRDERPDHYQTAIATARDNREFRTGICARVREIMASPVPAEIERLEDMNGFSSTFEQRVPLVFESIEGFPIADQCQFDIGRTGCGS